MTEKDIYDKRKFYKTKLEPLIHELKLQCNMEHMPMFVTVAVKNDKAGTEYASDMVLAGSGTEIIFIKNIRIISKRISGRFLSIWNGLTLTSIQIPV